MESKARGTLFLPPLCSHPGRGVWVRRREEPGRGWRDIPPCQAAARGGLWGPAQQPQEKQQSAHTGEAIGSVDVGGYVQCSADKGELRGGAALRMVHSAGWG